MSGLVKKIYYNLPAPLQELAIDVGEFKSWKLEHSKKYQNYLTQMRKIEKMKIEDLIRLQEKYMRYIVRYAYRHVPFYHKLYKKHSVDIFSIKTRDDLKKLPIIKKHHIIDNPEVFSSEKVKYIIAHTSGTTGKPLTIRISYNQYILSRAIRYGLRFIWSGYEGSYIARFVGDSPVKFCDKWPLYRRSHLLKRIYFPSYCLSFQTLDKIIHTLKKDGIRYIQAYPSTAYLIAKYLEIKDDYLSLKTLYYSSEPLYDYQREIIKERFKTKLFGSYGQAEEVARALECEKESYHLTMVDGIMEIVKNGEVLSPREKGFVVATSLHNTAMPLIRYYLGDYTGYKDDECSCGRHLPLIYPVETKMEDFIVTPDGRIISPSILTFPLKYARNIVESQIVQKSVDKIVVKIVRGEGYTDRDENNLLHSLREILGENMEIKIEYVNKIYQTKAYKKRFVINELGRDFIERAFSEAEKD